MDVVGCKYVVVAAICMTVPALDERELWSAVRGRCSRRAYSCRLPVCISMKSSALYRNGTCVHVDLIPKRVFALLNTPHTCPLWLLEATSDRSVIPILTQTLGTTHSDGDTPWLVEPKRVATSSLSWIRPARGCNRYGAMDPQRHARPSAKQRLQIRNLKFTGPLATPSGAQEPLQQKTVRDSSPPQNEQGGGGVSSIKGRLSSSEQ